MLEQFSRFFNSQIFFPEFFFDSSYSCNISSDRIGPICRECMFTDEVITIITNSRGIIHDPCYIRYLIQVRRESSECECILQGVSGISRFPDKGIFIRIHRVFNNKNTTRITTIKCKTEKLLLPLYTLCDRRRRFECTSYERSLWIFSVTDDPCWSAETSKGTRIERKYSLSFYIFRIDLLDDSDNLNRRKFHIHVYGRSSQFVDSFIYSYRSIILDAIKRTDDDWIIRILARDFTRTRRTVCPIKVYIISRNLYCSRFRYFLCIRRYIEPDGYRSDDIRICDLRLILKCARFSEIIIVEDDRSVEVRIVCGIDASDENGPYTDQGEQYESRENGTNRTDRLLFCHDFWSPYRTKYEKYEEYRNEYDDGREYTIHQIREEHFYILHFYPKKKKELCFIRIEDDIREETSEEDESREKYCPDQSKKGHSIHRMFDR